MGAALVGRFALGRGSRYRTGVGFGRWRTRLRVRAALELLAAGTPVAVAGRQVGYQTASAFIAAFRRELGVTPSRCFSS